MSQRYTKTARMLHWLIGFALIGQVSFGWYLDEIERGSTARSAVVNLHKSIGLSLGVLIVVRLVWRLWHRPPPLPNVLPTWQRMASQISHVALYMCMVGLPLSGYIASNFSRWGIKYFGVALSPWGPDEPQFYAFFNGTHVLVSHLFIGLIVLHVLAAIYHLVTRDGVFARMSLVPIHAADRSRASAEGECA